MFNQLGAACQTEVGAPFIEMNSSGSVENLDRIIANEVPAAIVQIDVLHWRGRTDDLSRIKALFSLHPEEIHIVTRNIVRKEGGTMGIGAKEVTLSTLSDLRGRKVGSWGGSFVTTQVLKLQAEVAFAAVELGDQPAALKALDEGAIDAIVSVGGSPVKWIRQLDRKYKLISIGEAEAAKLKNVYRPARLSYPNMGQTGVSTISTAATMVVRDYKTPAFQTMLTKVRDCFTKHLPEIQEKPGNHAKWASVDLEVKPNWPLYEGAVVAASAAPGQGAPEKKPKK
jgi:TRAP-type uncharacterized transport system substrate-binding protein